jgi:hypothetical protein
MVVTIKARSKIMKQMAMENFMVLIIINTKVNGKIICRMVSVRLYTQMEVDI